ncbi:MAG: hypothetical protein MJA30_21595, partial [Cytophagales bacterium]|nr:hypothetical protein [Cytophagales bacterium]
MKKIHIIATTDRGIALGRKLQMEIPKSVVVTTRKTPDEHISQVDSIAALLSGYFQKTDAFIFITSLGACVRLIAPYLIDKSTDPAVLCMDDHARFVQSVVGGHQGGANQLAAKVSKV